MKKSNGFWLNPLFLLGFISIFLTGCPPPADPPVEPTLTTSTVASITTNSATSGGNITVDGRASITNRGVCWNTSPGPSISNSKTSDGSGTGNFTSSLSGLNPGITYYVRGYATNSVGTGYGNEISFTTSAALSAITTTAITSITVTGASSGGNITADGGGAITARGVCWSTTTGPSITNSKTSDGTGTGSFVSSISGLTAGTKYYVRSYSTNSAGTSYGTEVSFTASANLPTLSATTAASSVTTTTAASGGNVTADGGGAITARGVCWSTTSGPTIANSKTTDTGTAGIFTSSISGLTAGTTYYVRAYATNSAGTGYGSQVSFTTTTATTGIIFNPNLTYGILNDIDGNVYKTIQIGTQVWMAENLKTTKYKDGTTIQLVTDSIIWHNLSTPGYCWYNNETATYKSTYGALYNWYTVNTGKLCPTGWHVPSDTEWTVLTTYLGGESVAGGKLKETGLGHWLSPNTGATNETGFSAVPGGYRYSGGTFYRFGDSGIWWSSSEASAAGAWYRHVYHLQGNVGRLIINGRNGYSVRCLKD